MLHSTIIPRSQGNTDDRGWPKNGATLTASTFWYPPEIAGRQLVLGWQGTSSGFYFNLTGYSGAIVSGGAFVNEIRPTDSGSVNTLTAVGTNGRIVFTIASPPPPPSTQINIQYKNTSGYVWTDFRGLYLCYIEEEAEYLAAIAGNDPGALFRQEFVDAHTELGLTDFRPMGWTNPNDSNNESLWNYRPDWKNDFNIVRRDGWYDGLWAGTISGDGDYTCSAPPDWPGLVHGVVVQGRLASNNTKKFPTLTVGSEDTIRIAAYSANTPFVAVAGTIAIGNQFDLTFYSPSLPGGDHTVSFTATVATAANVAAGLVAAIAADATLQAAHIWTDYGAGGVNFRVVWSYDITNVTDIVPTVVSGSGTMDAYMGSLTQTLTTTLVNTVDMTFTYDDYLKCFKAIGTGITNRIPLEVQIAFSNRIGTNFWATFPPFATDDYITNAGTMLAAEVASDKTIDIELSNEEWNPGASFQQTTYARCIGLSFGLPFGTRRDISVGYGLRVSRMFDQLDNIPALVTRGYNGVVATQAANFAGSDVDQYRFSGADLHTGTLTPTGDNRYARVIGQNYNASPNRPRDRANVLSYATYYSGSQSRNFGQYGNLELGGPDGSSISGLIGAADAYDSGDPAQMQAAIEWMDWDINRGLDFGAKTGSSSPPRISVTSMTMATPGVVTTSGGHGLSVGSACAVIPGGTNGFTSSGTLPSNIVAGRNYYAAVVPTTTTFQVAETPGGPAIAFASAATGTNFLGTIGTQAADRIETLYYQPFETLLASYDASRASLGKPPLQLKCYEGGLELAYPTASTTSDGTNVTGYSGAGGKFDLLYQGYKRSVECRRTVRRQMEVFMSYSHSTVAAQLDMFTGNTWSLHAGEVGSEKWQSYYGVKRFANRTKTVDVD